MSHASAYVVEIAGVTAGLAVADDQGFLFFASRRDAYALDGRRFRTLAAVNAAVARLLERTRGRHAGASDGAPVEAEVDRAAA